MRKLYFLLTFLTFVGFGTVSAQNFDLGVEVTDIASIAGSADGTQEATPILLMSSSVQSWNPGSYISPYGFESNIVDACVYEIYATGETVESDGEQVPTYRVWNVSIQKWLRAEVYGNLEDTSGGVSNPEAPGVLHGYTTEVSEAYVCTILHPEEGSTNRRTMADNCDADAWILAESTAQPDGMGIGYFGTYASGFFSIYKDTNQWRIYEATSLSGDQKLSAYILALFPSGLTYYVAGTTPGCVPQAAYTALETAYNTANELVGTGLTDDEVETACNELAAAKAVADAAIIVPEAEKYYFLINNRSSAAVYPSGGNLVGYQNYTVPTAATITTDDAKYVWKFIAATDTTFYLQNLYTGQYAGETSTTSGTVPMTSSPEAVLHVVINMNNEPVSAGRFNIYTDDCYYHIDGSYNMVKWNYLSSNANLFQIVECSADMIAVISESVEQTRLNNELDELYSTAAELYSASRVYTGETLSLDGNFDDLGLVVDASALSTNAQETTEGSLEGLLDADFTSYFHSIWSSSSAAPSDYHYVQADLGVSEQTLAIKYAKRHNNQVTYNPTKVKIYGSNDAENWTFCGTYPLTYDYSALVSDVETANFVGVRGFDMGAAYQYVRVSVIEHQRSGGTINGYPYFYLSELHFYPATYSPENSSLYESVDATVRANFESAIATTISELNAGAATQATINSLQSAYDAFLAAYADPQILTDSVAAARAVVADSLIGDALGLYPQAAADALNAVIDNVEATIATGMSMDLINSGVAQLQEAVTAYKQSYNLPEAGKVYAIRGLTTNSYNSRALNAVVYSLGNSETTSLRSQAQEDGQDPVDPISNLNYLWEVEEVSYNSIVLRNLGTNYYMGRVESLNAGVPNVAEKTTLGLSPINMSSGGFFIQVGDSYYLNFAGGSAYMVGWSSHSGRDNSSLQFEEISMEDWDPSTSWPVTNGVYQVLTLPFDIYTPTTDDGKAYTALGQKETDGAYTLELKEIDDEVITAGTPFVFYPAGSSEELVCILAVDNIDELTYAATGSTTENGALTGTIANTTLNESGKAILSGGRSIIIGGSSLPYTVSANSGYFNYVTTTETGDASIALSSDMVSGISGIIAADDNAPVSVYTISGVQLRKVVKASNATDGLPTGLYIVGGKKVFVK